MSAAILNMRNGEIIQIDLKISEMQNLSTDISSFFNELIVSVLPIDESSTLDNIQRTHLISNLKGLHLRFREMSTDIQEIEQILPKIGQNSDEVNNLKNTLRQLKKSIRSITFCTAEIQGFLNVSLRVC